MKGLIQKDLYMIWAYCRAFLLMVLVFTAAGGIGKDNWFFVLYPMLIGVMMPVSILSYDEKSHWDRYCGALPVSRAQVVSSLYLLTLAGVAVMLVLIVLVQGLRLSQAGRLAELPAIIAIALSIGLVFPAILMPIQFRLGVEKGRIAYYIITGAACAIGVFAAYHMPDTSAEINLSPSAGTLLFTAAAALLYALSWLLSIRFYEKREI